MLLRTPRSDDPVSGEKLLRFRKYAVSDRFSVLSGPDELGFTGPSQTLSRNEYTGIFQFFAECAHETHIRLKIRLRPPRISLEVGLLAGHHQNVFHIFSPLEFGAACRAIAQSEQASVLDMRLFGIGFMGCELADFDRHVCGFASGSETCGNPAGDGISTPGVGDGDAPMA